MPIIIGGKQESGFDDPLGLLGDCHRRIERFLAILSAVANQAGGAELNEEQRTAMEKALRYFREAAPRHTADEEESLFPRLRRTEQASSAMAQIAALEHEHEQATAHHDEIDRLGRHWLAEGQLPAAGLESLQAALRALDALYKRHIEMEETVVFPLAARVLSDSDKTAVGREMATRRKGK